jgi:putative spermidine/putrescine transport system substrate-binding protein
MKPRIARTATLAAAAFALIAAAPPPAAAQTKVTILTWAGNFLEAFQSVRPDIEKATGTKIEFVTQGSGAAGLTTLEAQKANPQVDLWTAPEGVATTALAGGVIEPVAADQVPNTKNIPPKLIFPAGPAIWMSPRGIFYRVDKTPFEIKTWEDLWDPRLKGLVTVSIQQDKGAFMLISALLAGGSEKDMDKGFEKMKALKPNLGAVYKGDAESLKFVESGEVAVVGWGVLGVIYKHLGPGSNYRFVMPKKPQFLSTNLITLVKGRPHKAESLKVMNAILEAGNLERIVEFLGSIPSNRNAKAPSKIRDVIPPLGDDIYQPDWKVVDANYGAWVDRWNREIQTR